MLHALNMRQYKNNQIKFYIVLKAQNVAHWAQSWTQVLCMNTHAQVCHMAQMVLYEALFHSQS